MGDVPSLFSLCMKTITMTIVEGSDHMQDIFELPSDMLDSLVMNLPPLALQNFHELLVNECGRGGYTANSIDDGRKRGRYGDFNTAWKTLFKKRWPENVKKIQPINRVVKQADVEICDSINHSVDWQQLYWETHLQNCLDEAAERALLPDFDGYIGELAIPDSTMKSIGQSGGMTLDHSKLSYHCQKFGHYARCLRLQNVLCVAETCELLKDSKLQALVFRRIISNTHVNGVCKILNQNRETLLSLEFIHCRLPPTTLNQICSSIYDGTQMNRIRYFSIKSSSIFQSKPPSMPTGLLSFLSSGRSLVSLNFCDTRMGPKVAKMIFDTLLDASCALITLEISDNNIAGWLSQVNRSFSSLLGSDMPLKSLSVLNIRGNNLCKDDAGDLNYALLHIPNLRSLDISDNPIKDEGIRSLIPYFIKAFGKECPLLDLKIENCNLSGMGVAELLRSLPTLKEPLNTLSVADNDLGSSVAAPLAKFLGTSRVRVLNIEDIELGPSGFQELEEEMPKAMALVYINISKNRGGISAANFISKIILQAPELLAVNAGYNFMPSDSVAVIHDALKQSKGKLEQLDLTGNIQLCQPIHASTLSEFKSHGKPIVLIPLLQTSSAPYDDDP